MRAAVGFFLPSDVPGSLAWEDQVRPRDALLHTGILGRSCEGNHYALFSQMPLQMTGESLGAQIWKEYIIDRHSSRDSSLAAELRFC